MTTVEWSRVPCPYLATGRRFAAVRGFLRALTETLDVQPRFAAGNTLLRTVGARLAGLMPLAAGASLGNERPV